MPDGVAVQTVSVLVPRQEESVSGPGGDRVPVSVEVESFGVFVEALERAAEARSGVGLEPVLARASDELLAEAVVRGVRSDEAFQELCQRYSGKVTGWFRNKLRVAGHSGDSEDLAQNTFVLALEGLRGESTVPPVDLEGQGRGFGSWLFGICARRVLADHQRAIFRAARAREIAVEDFEHARSLGDSDSEALSVLATVESLPTPTESFLAQRCCVDPESRVRASDLYAAWQAWCERNRVTVTVTANQLGAALRSALPQVQTRQFRLVSNGERSRPTFYLGISLRPDSDDDPDTHQADSGEPPLDCGRLAQALAQLTPAERRIVQVRYLENQTLDTCADILGYTHGAARETHHHALKSLRAALGAPMRTTHPRDISQLTLAKPWSGHIWYQPSRADYTTYLYVRTPEGATTRKNVTGTTADIVRERVAELLTQLETGDTPAATGEAGQTTQRVLAEVA